MVIFRNQDCLIYSVDLSAAFDMLRKDTLQEIISDLFGDSGLHPIIYDFLSDRRCVVDVHGEVSREFDVSLGCVQGSVLGPKLFNLYTRLMPT